MNQPSSSRLPIGLEVDCTLAKRPTRTVMTGRHVIVTPLDPAAHAQHLFDGTHGPDGEAFWLYMSEGPFADVMAFRAHLEKLARSEERLSFSIIDRETGNAVGHASYMRISPEHKVLEVGNIFYTSELA